jgi:PBSX family phage terminase large subunit
MKFARGYGVYRDQKAEFKFYNGPTVYVRTATNPESLEGITNVRGAWCDEAGQMSRYFFENVEGRCALKQAPVISTTTPYSMNWLSQTVKNAQEGKDPDVKVIQLRSIDSPYFPRDEYERQKKKLDPRRFAMKYEGLFGQMQGLVYDSINVCRSIPLPSGTTHFGGIDWGHTDPFVLVTRAITADGVHYRRDEYYKTGLIASEIMDLVQARHQTYQYKQVFCDPSRPEFIEELCRKGVPAVAANNDIRLGIDKHTELIKLEKFWIFEDMNPFGLDEYRSYHYPEPKELKFDDDSKEQDPVDANNHGCDADRYVTMGTYGITEGRKLSPKAPEVAGEGKKTEMQKLRELMRPKRSVM